MSLACESGAAGHHVRLGQANRNTYDTYGTLKETAAAYLEAQLELMFAAREAHDQLTPPRRAYPRDRDNPGTSSSRARRIIARQRHR